MKKFKNTKIKVLVFLLIGTGLFLFNCQPEEEINIEQIQKEFTVPKVAEVKQKFQQLLGRQNYLKNSSNSIEIFWEESSVKYFKEDIDILYTPIELNAKGRYKSLLASVARYNEIESVIFTLVYDDDSNNRAFSGYIFKHDVYGDFLEAYQYKNGSLLEIILKAKTTPDGKTTACNFSIEELKEMDMYDPSSILLDCIHLPCEPVIDNGIEDIDGDGGGSGSGNPNPNPNWNNPSPNLRGSGNGGNPPNPNQPPTGGGGNNPPPPSPNPNPEPDNPGFSEDDNWWEDTGIRIMAEYSQTYNIIITSAQSDFLLANPIVDTMVRNFLNLNITPQDKRFAEIALKTLMEGGEVDFDNKLIYNPIVAQDYKNKMSPSELVIFNRQNKLTKFLYLKAATQAYIYSETHFPKPVRNRLGDAFKHALWNALSTVYIGEALTEQLTTAHEKIPYDYSNHFKETSMDYHSNAQGRQLVYGSGKLYKLVQNALNNGDLKYLSNLTFRDGFWNATDNSQLIPTNQ